MPVRTHLMFQGDAEAALALYARVFPAFRVAAVGRYGPGEAMAEGRLKTAEVEFDGHALLVFDSPPVHAFGFTPAVSLMVDLPDPGALDAAAKALSEGGETLMPPGDYGFSARYAWVSDRYGLSWQLNVPH